MKRSSYRISNLFTGSDFFHLRKVQKPLSSNTESSTYTELPGSKLNAYTLICLFTSQNSLVKLLLLVPPLHRWEKSKLLIEKSNLPEITKLAKEWCLYLNLGNLSSSFLSSTLYCLSPFTTYRPSVDYWDTYSLADSMATNNKRDCYQDSLNYKVIQNHLKSPPQQ